MNNYYLCDDLFSCNIADELSGINWLRLYTMLCRSPFIYLQVFSLRPSDWIRVQIIDNFHKTGWHSRNPSFLPGGIFFLTFGVFVSGLFRCYPCFSTPCSRNICTELQNKQLRFLLGRLCSSGKMSFILQCRLYIWTGFGFGGDRRLWDRN